MKVEMIHTIGAALLMIAIPEVSISHPFSPESSPAAIVAVKLSMAIGEANLTGVALKTGCIGRK